MAESNATQVILTDDGIKIIKAQNTANNALNGVNSLNDPNLMNVIEKHSNAMRFDGLTSQYNVIIEDAKDDGVDTTALTTAYNDLNNFMAGILADPNHASDIDRATYKKYQDAYNEELAKTQNDFKNSANNEVTSAANQASQAAAAARQAFSAAQSVRNSVNNLIPHTHIAYANSADGKTDFSVSDSNRTYLGMYVDFSYGDSTNSSDYTWSLIKGHDGAQGIPGKAGADGKTPYFHIAYADSSDGKTNFSLDTPGSRKYIGSYTDFTQADSENQALYSWQLVQGPKGEDGDQGIPGKPGADGKTQYTHIAYANSATGGGFSEQPAGKTFIGMYVDFEVTDSTDVTKYNWSLIKGEDGAQGIPGKDGKTSYTHIAYADTATGGGFSQSSDNKKYIGIYTDFIADDSNDVTNYNWSLIKGADGANGKDGVPGSKGADGKTPYFHIAYADSSDGNTNFSLDTPGSRKYIGSYTDFTQADSTNPSAYSWQLVQGPKGDTGDRGLQGLQGPQGDQGIKGPAGADGKSSYTHIAYGTSSSGAGFTQTPSASTTYIGMYVDQIATDSNDPADYAWSLIKGEDGSDGIPGKAGADGKTPYLHIAYANSADGKNGFYVGGGTNLLTNTGEFNANWGGMTSISTIVEYDGHPSMVFASSPIALQLSLQQFSLGKLQNSTQYTASFWAKADNAGDKAHTELWGSIGATDFVLTTNWVRYTAVVTSASDVNTNISHSGCYFGAPTGNKGNIYISEPKLELGTTATPWSPAPSETHPIYMGTYTDFTQADSLDPTAYQWSQIKGDDGAQGIPGKAGADGKTPYFHQAWADSSDGNTNFSTTISIGKKYLGTYTDYVAADSTDPTIYKWTELVGAMQVGGRNLYLNSKAIADGYGIISSATSTLEPFDSDTNMWHIVAKQGAGGLVGIYLLGYATDKLPGTSDWSYSADVKGTGKVVEFGIEAGNKNPIVGTIGSEWSRISQTGHFDNSEVRTIVMYFDSTDSPIDVYIKLPKLESGNMPTDWTPAPEDQATQSQIIKLRDDISLFVEKGDLLSQINMQAGYTLITASKQLTLSSNTIYFDTDNPVVIPSANITGTLEGKKLKTADIEADTFSTKNKTFVADSDGKITAKNMTLTGGVIAETDIKANTFSTNNGTFQVDKNGVVTANNLIIRNLVYNASLLGGNGNTIPGWSISNNGYYASNMVHDGVPSIEWNNTTGAGVWTNFAQTKLYPLNGLAGLPFSASVWFLEMGSDTSLLYQVTLAFFDSNGNRINGGFVGNTWNGISSRQDWRYVTIDNAVAPSNAISVGLQYWAYNGKGNAEFSSPMLTQTAHSTGYQPDTGNIVSAGIINGSVINGSTINGTTFNAGNKLNQYGNTNYPLTISSDGSLNNTTFKTIDTETAALRTSLKDGTLITNLRGMTPFDTGKYSATDTALGAGQLALFAGYSTSQDPNFSATGLNKTGYVILDAGTGLSLHGDTQSIYFNGLSTDISPKGIAFTPYGNINATGTQGTWYLGHDNSLQTANFGIDSAGSNPIKFSRNTTIGNLFLGTGHTIAMVDGSPLYFNKTDSTGSRVDIYAGDVHYTSLVKSSLLSVKKDVQKADTAYWAQLVNSIDLATYQYKTDDNMSHIRLSSIVDDVNDTKQWRLPDVFISRDENGKLNGVDDSVLLNATLATVQEQQKEIDQLNGHLLELEAKLNG